MHLEIVRTVDQNRKNGKTQKKVFTIKYYTTFNVST